MSLVRRLQSSWPARDHAARRLRRRGVLVLMYHEVLPDSFRLPSWLVVRESAFVEQMRWLRRHFDVVEPGMALAQLQLDKTSSQPVRPLAVVTFDDGYAGNLSCVLPVMRQLDLPFTVFVATSALRCGRRFWYDDVACALLARDRGPLMLQTSRGVLRHSPGWGPPQWRWARVDEFLTAIKRLPEPERRAIADDLGGARLAPELRMLREPELAELARDPRVTLGNHTRSHELLDQIGLDEAKETIVDAQHDLMACTGTTPEHFCYPNGNYRPDTIGLVRELGFSTAMTTNGGLWVDPEDRLEVPRMSVGRFDAFRGFRANALRLVVRHAS